MRRIVIADAFEPAEQRLALDRHHSRIAQFHRALVGAGVLIFDHFLDAVALAQDDPAIGLAIVGRTRQHDHARRIVGAKPVEHSPERGRRDEGRIAVENESPLAPSSACLAIDRHARAFVRTGPRWSVAPGQRRLNLLAPLSADATRRPRQASDGVDK